MTWGKILFYLREYCLLPTLCYYYAAFINGHVILKHGHCYMVIGVQAKKENICQDVSDFFNVHSRF